MRCWLGISTLHIRGRHYADVYQGDGCGRSIWFCSYLYSRTVPTPFGMSSQGEYSDALAFVAELNAKGGR